MRNLILVLISLWAMSLDIHAGITPAVNAVQIQGRNISSVLPSNNQVLTWSTASSNWRPAAVSSGTTITPNYFMVTGNNLSDLSSTSTARTNLGLGSVENTALSTWGGSTSLTTLGAVSTGTWNASTIPVLYGGTGSTTASGARSNLSAAASGANTDITSLGSTSALTGVSVNGTVTTNTLYAGVGSTRLANFCFVSGNFIVSSNSTGEGYPSNLGAGSRLVWSGKTASIFAGNVSGTQWNTGSNGWANAVFGANNDATSGQNCILAGGNNVSSGSTHTYNSFFGYNNQASGSNVSYCFAGGGGHTLNSGSSYSTAFGASNSVTASYACAIGLGHVLTGYAETVIGQYSVSATETGTSWVASENVFVIGNGTGSGARSNAMTVVKDGRVYFSGIHNSSTSPSGATKQYIASGTYTPTLTSVANIDASTAYVCQWIRVGNVVSVSGKVDIDPTATTTTQIGISLPLDSNITANEGCSGTAFSNAVTGHGAAILGDATNDRAQLDFVSSDTSNRSFYFHFQYLIQ